MPSLTAIDSSPAKQGPRVPFVDNARDPLEAVFKFGNKAVRTGLLVGFAIATISHGAFGGRALLSPVAMQRWAVDARQQIHEHLWASYDVDVSKPEAAPPPKPEEEKKEEPEAVAVAVARDTSPRPVEAPAPAAAKAGAVLTAPADPGAPVDFTGDGFVTGTGDSYIGGVTAAAGTATAATYNKNAIAGGSPTGTGSGPVVPPPPKPQTPDLSRGAGVTGGSEWGCPFPPEADVDQVDFALVTIVVTVREDGTARSVKVVNDPGHGFGRAARLCALSQKYAIALDRDGNPSVGTTAPINVRFTR